jgi:LacI family transcriptional regulator
MTKMTIPAAVKSKPVTVKEVAQAAGVSKTTAVCVLNETPSFNVPEATRVRVRQAAERLGYRRNGLAAALSRGRIHTVGIVLPLPLADDTPPDEQVYAKEVIVAAARAAARADLRLTLVTLDPARPVSARDVADQRVDGLILVSIRDDAFARGVYATGFPCVGIGSGYSERHVPLDNAGAGRLAAEHLLGLGHTRLVYWTGSTGGGEGHARCAGFVRAAEAAEASATVLKDDDDLRRLCALPAAERPTGLFTFNDWRACRALRIAREEGLRVPEDLSIIGFDDNILSQMASPPLTTVHNPLAEQMEAAIDLLRAVWSGHEVSDLAPLPTRLIVRESTAPPPSP